MSTVTEEQIGEIPLEVKADLDAELVEEFISEAREQLQHIEQGTLALEKNADDQEVIHQLFRSFHTFKGNAGFLDFTAISSLAHLLESLLNGAREGRMQINPVMIEIILKSRDVLQQYIDEIEAQITGRKPRQVILIPTAAIKVAVKYILTGDKAAPEPAPQKSAPEPVAHEEEDEPTPTKIETTPGKSYATGTALNAVKVSTSKLDGLVDLAGELLIAQSLIVQNVANPGTSRHLLARNLDQLNRISKELQRIAMSLRMVPIRSTFQKMQRLARDVAAQQGKQVQLILEGEETEVDRTIVEKIADPLMHMVRNAVDHAIEPPDKRATMGKSPTGAIILRAYHKSGAIVIEVEDDGVGLNRERIREKAIEKGLLKPGPTLDEKELLGLIFHPGFSTATVVTNISGRGVGMDVVHKNIGSLRGKIDIKSIPSVGTTFTIRLPLTLAIIDGLIIRVGDQRYIIPTLSVRESFHPKTCEITSLPGGVEVVEMRKEIVPLLRLRDHFRLEDSTDANARGILVVIESDGKKRCLLADELLGKQEIVIKNLGEVFLTDPMISGGAILGDGCVGLILDPAALVHMESPTSDLRLAI